MIVGVVLSLIVMSIIGYLMMINSHLRTKLERTERVMERLDARPAIVAHEIRTPLTLIEASAELLASESPGALTDIQRSFVHTIFDNSQQAIGIAENSLAQRRLKDTHLQLRSDLVDVRDVVSDAAKSLRRTSPVPITIDVRGGILPIYADEQFIRQLVWNLVNNAIRHSEGEDGPYVRVSQAENGGALLEVSDRGMGMNASELEKFFTPFATGSSRRPGSGIGMLVSQEIVEAHGGRMMVDSQPGVGTTIVVLLPQGAPPMTEIDE